ncbi:hypothetical protein OS175_04160 [Marinicella sp. S1101]|uniref:hypothetical protein n=1 Tax=Marinicella marina TaxID=2996016 RepID=UPI002260B0BD|nr:hypothetical protein [Marinicella marina]MCX7553061.1 hypothetical protein [Marinicella marina]MDJ1139579.1 hypothetical protein [Marinicella marina]
MKRYQKLVIMWLCLMNALGATAVNLSTDGSGQVLLFPYYNVKGGYNSIYSVVNNSDEAKAIKVRFREGVNLVPVLQFNVYLSPRDVWTGVLTPTAPSDPQQEGTISVLHSTVDNSCAPFLHKAGEEFTAVNIPATDSNQSIGRATEGLIEVLEMGVVVGTSAAALQHDSAGIPSDCELLESAWSAAGYWELDGSVDLTLPTGKLSGAGVLLNMSEGQMVAYDAVALDDFWAADAVHTQPDDALPDLSQGAPVSLLQTASGYSSATWVNGYQAVSAVLMKSVVNNQYNISPFITGRTDWVISWPTKTFHTNPELKAPSTPFSELWDGESSCESYSLSRNDVNTLAADPVQLASCGAIAIVSFKDQFGGPGVFQTNAANEILIEQTSNNSDIGWASLHFDGNSHYMVDNEDQGLLGLPIIGFAVQKYRNAGAGQGLLAQYTELLEHKYQVFSFADILFVDGFDQSP